uniref:N-terminal kinase-like protein n=1 Tax=Eptatretus burgeri TaxID=7764 RepID=A0A8C4R6A9_EPTBU
MWFFSRDPCRDLAWEVGTRTCGLDGYSIWNLHHGRRKATGDPVSVFVFEAKDTVDTKLDSARAAFKRLKGLRHPSVLTFIDGLETDKMVHVVTEPVVPLGVALWGSRGTEGEVVMAGEPPGELAISWGIHQILKALCFLVDDCGLIHHNICMGSVFVDHAGDWKLSGLEYAFPLVGNDLPPSRGLPALDKYNPPEQADISRGRFLGEKWAGDMWSLGCLIWEVFNGPLSRSSSLKSLGKIPVKLVPHYCELVGANPRARRSPANLLQILRFTDGFLDNSFVSTNLFLEEIQIKDPGEKKIFFKQLSQNLDSFPEQHCRSKVLPLLLHAFEFGSAGAVVLAPLFKLGKLLSAEEYQKKIIPVIVKMFSSTDRATRISLLQQMELFVPYLTEQTVNSQIFPHVAVGFLDTNPAVREQTIKSMLLLAHKLSETNLNVELMKHFARLQSHDDQGPIRCNTTVCLGKIAPFLSPATRQKVLISAFSRATKDPFPPSRAAGVLGLASTHSFYTMQDCAHRVLPLLCGLTLDPERSVRDQVFKSIKCFLGRLETLSEDPSKESELEKDVLNTSRQTGEAGGWAGWAVTGVASITSKFIRPGATAAPTASKASCSEPSPKERPTDDNSAPTAHNVLAPKPSKPSADVCETETSHEMADTEGDEEDWDDGDWGSLEETSELTRITGGSHWQQQSSRATSDFGQVMENKMGLSASFNDDGGDDDDWNKSWADAGWGEEKEEVAGNSCGWGEKIAHKEDKSLEKSPKVMGDGGKAQVGMKLASEYNWETMCTTTKKGKDELNLCGGWDTENWEPIEDEGVSRAEAARKRRDERNRQRQHERDARRGKKGPLHLGAQKLR